ncbi:hypothetical protein BpHYR1_007414 [Brachionus plicatilis]|uniref:Uncharacterized protein n=1 Tax=Brachionus plicatilis TaxID=10195 RepID=A0A3M7P121_BRAPC|nr:hypothetical protein BpHYR1_007414 [Brachionus plicatilis]
MTCQNINIVNCVINPNLLLIRNPHPGICPASNLDDGIRKLFADIMCQKSSNFELNHHHKFFPDSFVNVKASNFVKSNYLLLFINASNRILIVSICPILLKDL